MKRLDMARPVVNPKSGKSYTSNDLTAAKLQVDVVVGPSSASKKAAIVRSLTNMLSVTDDPESKQVLGAMVMLNVDGEGIGEVREFFRKKLLRLGVLEPTAEEAQKLAQEQASAKPDANTKYLEAAAEEAQAKAVKARADTVLTITRAEESKAKALKLVSEVDDTEQVQALRVIDKFGVDTTTPSPQGAPIVPASQVPALPASEQQIGEIDGVSSGQE